MRGALARKARKAIYGEDGSPRHRDYIVVEESSQTIMGEVVSKLLREGWNLHGGIFVETIPEDRTYYYQAMTK